MFKHYVGLKQYINKKSKRKARNIFKLTFNSKIRIKKHLNDRFALMMDVNSFYPANIRNSDFNVYIAGPQGPAVDTSRDC